MGIVADSTLMSIVADQECISTACIIMHVGFEEALQRLCKCSAKALQRPCKSKAAAETAHLLHILVMHANVQNMQLLVYLVQPESAYA